MPSKIDIHMAKNMAISWDEAAKSHSDYTQFAQRMTEECVAAWCVTDFIFSLYLPVPVPASR